MPKISLLTLAISLAILQLHSTAFSQSLAKSDDHENVYVVSNKIRRFVPNWATLMRMKLDGRQIQSVERGVLYSFPEGPPFPSYTSPGALIQEAGSPNIYFVIRSQKHLVPDVETFHHLSFDWRHVQKVDQLSHLAIGGDVGAFESYRQVVEIPLPWPSKPEIHAFLKSLPSEVDLSESVLVKAKVEDRLKIHGRGHSRSVDLRQFRVTPQGEYSAHVVWRNRQFVEPLEMDVVRGWRIVKENRRTLGYDYTTSIKLKGNLGRDDVYAPVKKGNARIRPVDLLAFLKL